MKMRGQLDSNDLTNFLLSSLLAAVFSVTIEKCGIKGNTCPVRMPFHYFIITVLLKPEALVLLSSILDWHKISHVFLENNLTNIYYHLPCRKLKLCHSESKFLHIRSEFSSQNLNLHIPQSKVVLTESRIHF